MPGGDPFVFGRGGEEALLCAEHGIPCEVVPGITAGVAAPAYAGIPVTHRDDASAVAFVTGHEDPQKDETALDWDALARFPGTLVLYMGVRNLAEIARRLIAAGRDPAQPAAVVQEGTLPAQRSITGELSVIAEKAQAAEIRAPAIVLVGDVARRAEVLGWLDRRPLHGRTVVVTRARAQASSLTGTLRELGATVLEVPAIRFESRISSDAVADAMAALHTYALICLTSTNAVEQLFEAMQARGLDARALASATVAAIGPGSARALAQRGVVADVVAERYVAEGIIEALEPIPVDGRPVLIPRAARGRDELGDWLTGRGAKVDVVTLYETFPESLSEEELAAAEQADYLTFTASSTVQNFVEAMGDRLPTAARVISIGPVTSGAARELGLTVHAEAERNDLDGLVEALLGDVATHGD
jgi:uroporphyrinogen III methyltransferase/synthase